MKILVVDDNATNRKLLRAQLEAEGHDVLEAADGAEALQVLERECMHAVISDILMPNMDGFNLCREIRLSEQFGDLPLILYTSTYDSPTERQLATTVGADRYVVKPAPAAVILEALYEVMQNVGKRNTPLAPQPDAAFVLKQYSEALVQKLEEKNSELMAAEGKFRALVEQSIVGIYIIQDDHFVYVNPRMAEVFGRAEEEMTSRTIYDFVVPEDHALTRENLRQQTSGWTPSIHYYLRILHHSGAVLKIEIHGNRVDYNGRPAVMGTLLDITERERANEELRQSEERYRLLFERSPDTIFALTPTGTIASLNHAFETLTGWPPDQWLGRLYQELIHPDDQARARELFQLLLRGKRVPIFELRVMTAAGGFRHIEVMGFSNQLSDGRMEVQGISRDITDRKLAEAEIQNLNAKLEQRVQDRTAELLTANDTLADFKAALDEHANVAITDTGGTITYVNDKFCSISQYSRDELVGKDHRIINSGYHPKAFMRELWETITSGLVWKGQMRNRAKDRTLYWVDATIIPFLDTHGEPSQYIAICTDITARKLVEEQLVQAREAAEFANRAKSDFLASMSHELRTPLNGILGMNELLMSTELTARQRQFVEACSTSGKTLLQQINDILDLSKIEAGKLELDPHECHLESLVCDIADVFSHSAQQKGYPLHCHIDPSACVTAQCDGNRLRQILVNLIGNAIKFTASGGVTVRAECVPRQDRQLALRISVTDTGVGIPADRRDCLFTPFSQVDSSTSRKFGGTGLGLAICHQLAELMGGKIGVESQLGVGSTFWVEVSLLLATEDKAIAERRHLLVGKRVLAVDGIDRARKQIGDSLHAWGCSFEQVATLAAAMDTIASAEGAGTPFAGVLADCRLIVGDEFGLLQKFAKDSQLPIIGLGTDLHDETIAYLRQLGVRHVLRDPVRPSDLINSLASALSLSVIPPTDCEEPANTTEERSIPLQGHVLVAEDNPINQLYIVELLKHFGCTSDVAVNGEEALNAIQQQHYDLVLMDCQMPEMDGFTACRNIRHREAAGELVGRLSIIALTANALKGDRERCLEAGMDDYLSKPLQAAQFRATLARFLRPTSSMPSTHSYDAI